MTGRGRRVGGSPGDGRAGRRGGKSQAGKGWCAMVAVSGLWGACAKRGGVQWWLCVHGEVPLQALPSWQHVEKRCPELKLMYATMCLHLVSHSPPTTA